MNERDRLLTIQETAGILHLNPEVVRRWLRAGKINGIKVGSDWRVSRSALDVYLKPKTAGESSSSEDLELGRRMCLRFPRWLEFSGLPRTINEEAGPLGWPIFRILVEIDFEWKTTDKRRFPLDFPDLAERCGYSQDKIKKMIVQLAKLDRIKIGSDAKHPEWFEIVVPLQVPRSILDIPFSLGGVKGAPEKGFESRCLRRYVR